MKYLIIFTIKNGLFPFKEVVVADTVEQAHTQLKEIVKQCGGKLNHITSTIEYCCDAEESCDVV
jgi:hypothetical protein